MGRLAFGSSDKAIEWVRSIMIEPSDVADSVVEGLAAGRFLIMPHPEVEQYFQNKAGDYERWLGGMRKLRAGLEQG